MTTTENRHVRLVDDGRPPLRTPPRQVAIEARGVSIVVRRGVAILGAWPISPTVSVGEILTEGLLGFPHRDLHPAFAFLSRDELTRVFNYLYRAKPEPNLVECLFGVVSCSADWHRVIVVEGLGSAVAAIPEENWPGVRRLFDYALGYSDEVEQ